MRINKRHLINYYIYVEPYKIPECYYSYRTAHGAYMYFSGIVTYRSYVFTNNLKELIYSKFKYDNLSYGKKTKVYFICA